MRQIVLDTETTGLSPEAGHRITEIGCLEIIDRKITGSSFQTYINPERELDEGAVRITGLTTDFLADKPKFIEIVDEFLNFIEGAELIIHNAPFDVGFIDHELNLIEHPWQSIKTRTTILDTLLLARKKYPGQRNSLDALCKRLNVDNSNREYHGALLDSEILARVYLSMTSGQTRLNLLSEENNLDKKTNNKGLNTASNLENSQKFKNLKVIKASPEELKQHEEIIALLNSKSENGAVWNTEN